MNYIGIYSFDSSVKINVSLLKPILNIYYDPNIANICSLILKSNA